jgi:hypothetical protein
MNSKAIANSEKCNLLSPFSTLTVADVHGGSVVVPRSQGRADA